MSRTGTAADRARPGQTRRPTLRPVSSRLPEPLRRVHDESHHAVDRAVHICILDHGDTLASGPARDVGLDPAYVVDALQVLVHGAAAPRRPVADVEMKPVD